MPKKITHILDDEFFKNENFQMAIDAFAETRKMKRAPLTEYALKLIMKKLHDYSDNNVTVAIKIVEQSIELGYQGVFPLKEETTNVQKEFSRKREEL